MVRAKIVYYDHYPSSYGVVVEYKGKRKRVPLDFFEFVKVLRSKSDYVNIEIKKHKFLWFKWETWRLK